MFDDVCPFCDYEPPFDVQGIFPEYREIDAIYCCEDYREAHTDYLNSLDPEEWAAAWRAFFKQPEIAGPVRAVYGLEVRGVAHDHPADDFALDFKLRVEKLDRAGDQTAAKAFIAEHHRHNPPPAGWLFGYACYNGPDLVGVVWAGRPVSRHINHFKVIEINRNCVRDDLRPQLVKDACSMLYGAAAREAERLGYLSVITYTLESESGTTLKAAGFERSPVPTRAGDSWDKPGRRRVQKSPTEAKYRWTRTLKPDGVAVGRMEAAEKDHRLRGLVENLWSAVVADLKARQRRPRASATPLPPPPAPRASYQPRLF